MTSSQRTVLFWVVIAVFVGAAVVSLGVFSGTWPWDTSPFMERWAVGTFLASVVGTVIAAFKRLFTPRVDLFVAIDLPDGVDLQPEGQFQIWDEQRGQAGRRRTILVESTPEGGWFCRLPQSIGMGDRVRLLFQETSGVEWQVRYFSPRFNRQSAVPVWTSVQPGQTGG